MPRKEPSFSSVPRDPGWVDWSNPTPEQKELIKASSRKAKRARRQELNLWHPADSEKELKDREREELLRRIRGEE
jgi:hypothetical protein